jgi:hypothetical protein
MSRFILFFVSSIALVYFLFFSMKPEDYKQWNQSKDSLLRYTQQTLAGNEDLNFYTPYRDRPAESRMVVVCEDSIYFNMHGRVLIPSGHKLYNRMRNKGFFQTVGYYFGVITRVRNLERKGLHTVYRQDSLTRISTTFYDSSYQQLVAVDPEYKNYLGYSYSQHRKDIPCVIQFIIVNKPLSAPYLKLLHSNYYLSEIDKNSYYHRGYIGLKIYSF